MSEPTYNDPHHRLMVRGQLGTLQMDVATTFCAPWTVLFGPSGSGKSLLLQLIVGTLRHPSPATLSTVLLQVSRYELDATWFTLADNRQKLAPESRAVAYAPQTALLFPHLSVCENVSFARKTAGGQLISAADSLIQEAREIFELEPFWRRRTNELSGGEQQRVNLARAFARPGSRLLLLDEPFTGLDRVLRARILDRLRPALAKRTLPVISVTHDIEEAFLLGAEIVRVKAGRMLAQGPAAEVLAIERKSLLAALDAP